MYLDCFLRHVFDFHRLIQILVAAEIVLVHCLGAAQERHVWKAIDTVLVHSIEFRNLFSPTCSAGAMV